MPSLALQRNRLLLLGKGFAPESVSLLTSLISWWKLDETSGSRADAFGANTLTDNNTVLFGVGKKSNAADFELDTSESLSVASNASLVTGDIDYTLAGWVNMEALPGAGLVGDLITKMGTATREYQFYYDRDGAAFNFQVWDGLITIVGQAVSTFGAASAGTWYFVHGYHSATGNEAGVSVNGGTVNVAATTGASGSGASALYMGYRDGPAGSVFLDGLLDEWGFWKRLLTPAEISYLYNNGLARTLVNGVIV